MAELAAVLVIVLAVGAVMRQGGGGGTPLLGARGLGALAGQPEAIVRTFLEYFTRDQFLLPIGCCMGFAYVLRHTGCDQHLVHLLVRPLQRVHGLLIPGAVVVGVVVNAPLISQASTLAGGGAGVGAGVGGGGVGAGCPGGGGGGGG